MTYLTEPELKRLRVLVDYIEAVVSNKLASGRALIHKSHAYQSSLYLAEAKRLLTLERMDEFC